MGVTLILKHIKEDGCLKFAKCKSEKLDKILRTCAEKNNGYVCVTIDRPRKPRTTGLGSQNNLIWKLITLIANETGDDSAGMSDTENGIKERSLSKGYPFHVNQITGRRVPESMTKIDTVQCGYLIETAYEVCAELGIVIPPNL